MKNIAIILASGKGERAGFNLPKQFVKIFGKTILEYSIEIFENHELIDEIIIVSNGEYIDLTNEIVHKNGYKKVKSVISGGLTRKDSSFMGISEIEYDDAKVLIHDAARPFASAKTVTDCLNILDTYDAATVAINSSDTLVEVAKNEIVKIPERKSFMRVQTPQAFKLKTILKAHIMTLAEKMPDITDDCGLIKYFDLCKIAIVKGDETNIKITYPIDIEIAEKILQNKKCS